MGSRSLGEAGERLIKGFEELMLTPYYDQGGVLTVGWGHTAAAGGFIPIVGQSITKETAERIFRADISKFVRRVNSFVTVPINQNQFDALVSFDFNCGGLQKSTLLRRLNAGQYSAVPAEMAKWCRVKQNGQMRVSKGLMHRRTAEIALWGTPAPGEESEVNYQDASAQIGADPIPPSGKGMARSKIGGASVVIGGAAATDVAERINTTVQTAQQTADAATSAHDLISRLLQHPGTIALIVILILAGAIWYWRFQMMHQDAV